MSACFNQTFRVLLQFWKALIQQAYTHLNTEPTRNMQLHISYYSYEYICVSNRSNRVCTRPEVNMSYSRMPYFQAPHMHQKIVCEADHIEPSMSVHIYLSITNGFLNLFLCHTLTQAKLITWLFSATLDLLRFHLFLGFVTFC